ncbi:MAG: AAA+-type ATPase [Claussenomyces sp. TS43310]|nr:MAG: AAA+-type ATPase [Claussenomyces sp. TS43310]
MSITQNVQTLEVKIRNLVDKERQDQKDVSRVFFSKDALLDMRLDAGQPCQLWKLDDPLSERREAIAWPTPASRKLNKDVCQMFKTFQEVCSFRLEDRIHVAPAGQLRTAATVVLQDTTEGAALSDKDQAGWEWYMGDKLGMKFDVSLVGPKRTLSVRSISDGRQSAKLAKFGEESSVKIVNHRDVISVNGDLTGARPKLEVSGMAGIDRALTKLNGFLGDFTETREEGLDWDQTSCGVIIHGAHGSGKSLVLAKLANTCWGRVFRIDRETKPAAFREIFKEAKQCQPSLIILDNVDSVISKENNKSHGLDDLLGEEMDRLSLFKVLVVAAVTSINDVPRCLRKRGRFVLDILLPVPNAESRKEILKALAPTASQNKQLLDLVGERTHAYTPEDLGHLLDRACMLARRRVRGERANGAAVEATFLQEDIEEALILVRPSAMHDVTLQPPKVRWNEIGGQDIVKRALRYAVEIPRLYPDLIQRHGAVPKKGILLYGPPGCSKTLSAQAMATEISHNFFAVKGAELLNMYVGESERAVRDIFSKARAAAPSIIFFDEIESIGAKREGRGNNGVNVLTTLLNEMDGIEALKGVTVLAATNKPEMLDLALLRPGRFDDLLYVAPPDQAGREEILNVKRKKMFWAEDIDVAKLAGMMEGYSGAEVVSICQKACDRVIEKSVRTGDMGLRVQLEDFEAAKRDVKPQITADLLAGYKRWAEGKVSGLD